MLSIENSVVQAIERCLRLSKGLGRRGIARTFREPQGTGFVGSFSSFRGAPTSRGMVGSIEVPPFDCANNRPELSRAIMSYSFVRHLMAFNRRPFLRAFQDAS